MHARCTHPAEVPPPPAQKSKSVMPHHLWEVAVQDFKTFLHTTRIFLSPPLKSPRPPPGGGGASFGPKSLEILGAEEIFL